MRSKSLFYQWLCIAYFFPMLLIGQSQFIQNDILNGILENSASQIWTNPALLTEAESVSFSLTFEQRFRLKQFQTVHLAGHLPMGKTHLFAGIEHRNILDFNSTKLQLGLAKKLTNAFSIATKVQIHQTTIQGYGSLQKLGFGVASQLKMNSELRYLVYLNFPMPGGIADQIFKPNLLTGFDYDISNEINLRALFVKTINSKPSINIALAYCFQQRFFFRFQFKSLSNTLGFSFGSLWKDHFLINFGFLIHPQLAWSPGFNLSYQ